MTFQLYLLESLFMLSIVLFYTAAFFTSFFLCIPIGPVNIEVLHTALKKHYAQAISIAIGAAAGDSIWAMCAFFGISPFLKNIYLEASFFFFTSLITAALGYFAIKDAKFVEKKEEEIVTKIKRKRWALLKGISMVLVNPLGIVSWMVVLSFLRRIKIYIPLQFKYEVIFFVVVCAGAISYFSLIVFITTKMKALFNPRRTGKIIKFLGYLLLSFSLYFLYHSVRLFFFQGASSNIQTLVN